jgi:hypothetical protein
MYDDLVSGADGLGTPFIDGGRDPSEGLDCKSLALIAMRRCGKDLPELPLLGGASCEGEGARRYLESYLNHGADSWREVAQGDLYELGDLILQELETGPHASVVVELYPTKAITCVVGRGVVVVPVASMTFEGASRVMRWDP